MGGGGFAAHCQILYIQRQVQPVLRHIPVENCFLITVVVAVEVQVVVNDGVIDQVIAAVRIAQSHKIVATLAFQVIPTVFLIHAAHQHDLLWVHIHLHKIVEGPGLQRTLRGKPLHFPLLFQPGQLRAGDVGGGFSAVRAVVVGGFLPVHGALGILFHAGKLSGHGGGVSGCFRRHSLRVCGASGHHRHADHGGKNGDPHLGLLPIQQIFDAAFGIALAEGQRRPGDDAPSGGKAQEGRGVVRPDAIAQLLHHRLITAHLHVLGEENKCNPDQGIEPMDAQGEKGQSLDDMVAPADVVLLMEDDVALLLLGQ